MKKLLVKLNDQIIDQSQGEDGELAIWIQGNMAVGKYPDGYVVEIIDLDVDYDYQLAKCIEQRKAEYPTSEDFLNAYFDDQSKLADLQSKRLEIKAKYPKPVKA